MSGVRIYSNQRESRLPAMPKLTIPVSISLSCLLFLSGLLSILCLFSQPVQHNNSHSIHWPFLIQLHANTFTHTLHSLSLAAPPFLSRSVTHINSAPPLPFNRSLPLPSLTPNHSLPLTWNDCETTKTLGKHQIQSPHFRWGAKDYKNPTGRKCYEWGCWLTTMQILYWVKSKETVGNSWTVLKLILGHKYHNNH